jgi:hypothetical protein
MKLIHFIIIFLAILLLWIYDTSLPKYWVFVVNKRYTPQYISTPEMSEDEKYIVTVKHTDGTKFSRLFGFKELDIFTDKQSYSNISIGDTLKDKY